jgi:hypothetical protein
VLLSSGVLDACRTDPSSGEVRRWIRCTCSYVSDFDEPGAAPIDVCSDGRGVEEIASTCVRNDGVGIPTGCRCESGSLGPCTNRDRCRAAAGTTEN